MPVSRVDPSLLVAALPTVLERAGVERRRDAVSCLDTLRPEFSQVVLAAGASCRLLWPALPPRLRYSWAGVLTVPHNPGGSAWLELVRRGKVVLPRHWQRPGLEAKAAELEQQAWVVDTGLAPWGKQGVVLGQISPNGVFGEMALIDNEPRMASAEAEEEAVCLVIPMAALKARLDSPL